MHSTPSDVLFLIKDIRDEFPGETKASTREHRARKHGSSRISRGCAEAGGGPAAGSINRVNRNKGAEAYSVSTTEKTFPSQDGGLQALLASTNSNCETDDAPRGPSWDGCYPGFSGFAHVSISIRCCRQDTRR